MGRYEWKQLEGNNNPGEKELGLGTGGEKWLDSGWRFLTDSA